MSEALDEFRASFREAAIAQGAMPPEAREFTRDDAGRFAKSEPDPEPETTEPETEPEAEAAPEPEPEPERLYAGKYKTPDDLENAYQELQRKLGENSRDVQEYRRLQGEIEALKQAVEQSRTQAPGVDPIALANYLDERPDLAPQAAYEAATRGDSRAYEVAMEKWYEQAPRQAAAWERQNEIERVKQEMEAKIAASTQPIARQNQAQEFGAVLRSLTDEFPEIRDEKFAEAMLAEAQRLPAILEVLQAGDIASKEEAMRSLALMARGRMTDTLIAAATKANRQAQEEAMKAKEEAAVLTPSTSPTRTEGKASRVEEWREQFRNSDAYRKAAGLV